MVTVFLTMGNIQDKRNIYSANYSQVDAGIIQQFVAICGKERVILDKEGIKKYASDETEDLAYYPALVLKPSTTQEVAAIMKLCHQHKIPVTPRGAGTGLSGGALALFGGIVLSTENLNKILSIDERNLQATVEPGVINEYFQQVLATKKLFYPPDPASKGSCFLGGNIAENSGGPKCVKYGVTKDYILNLEVILANGEIINTGANTLKNSTGYNLTQLMVGSEGTLGIVTKIIVRLIPLPAHDLLMLVPFRKEEEACIAVSEIFKAGFTPSALEFMERDALEWVSKHVSSKAVTLTPDIQAHLLIEVDGNNMDVLMEEMEAISNLMQNYDVGEILFAESAAQKAELWLLRRKINEAVKSNAISKEQDTVVPRAELPALVKGVKLIGKKYGFSSVCYGHAGDGNLHIRIIKGDIADDKWNGTYIKEAIAEIFKLCKQLGGTISGEHGIGLVQKEYMALVFSKTEIELQKAIKNVFDPYHILNPGKIFE